MVLDRNLVNYFAEMEQAAFGTGVLVDGLDLSDDKMLQGRAFSYSDTHPYRVGPNYLQVPINRPQREVNANQRDAAMACYVGGADSGTNSHVNYEPSSLGGVKQAPRVAPPAEPLVEGRVMRHAIERTAPTSRRVSATARSRSAW